MRWPTSEGNDPHFRAMREVMSCMTDGSLTDGGATEAINLVSVSLLTAKAMMH